LLQALSSSKSGTSTHAQLWQLSYLIWFGQRMSGELTSDLSYNQTKVVALLLSGCANEIAERQGVLDVPMNGAGRPGPLPLEKFISESLDIISDEKAVRSAIAVITQHASVSQASDFEATTHLADYAVAMLRAFASSGDKARKIRQWLWQTSLTTTNGVHLSTLEYLWSSITKSRVFQRIISNHRNVLSALREASPETHQIGRPSTGAEEIELWRTEWRIVLFFMELYSFVLRVIDDDEFFSGASQDKHQSFETTSYSGRKGLNLTDAITLAMFLKNLAFGLYWHAAELVPTTDAEDLDNLSSLFGYSQQTSVHQTTSKHESLGLAGNGVSHAYLKGLSTALLRMLHERDSRRRFVPASGWLMTHQVDMSGFISAVVAEEEKRHELDDNDEEDMNLDEADDAVPTADSPRASFAQVMSGSGGINYSQAHLRNSVSERQIQQARKKRRIESLAPRLEILRNLPFFIPFESRVQIFRHFVYNDQVRRRNGHVDADIWRMSVARSTMGRDIDGRPPGFDVISRQHAEIRREHVFEDAYDSYYQLGDKLKEPIQISFIDKFGTPEAGIDGGGVTKEFLTSVTSEALDPSGPSPMFTENAEHFLYPNPLIWQEMQESLRREGTRDGSEGWNAVLRDYLRRYEFLGRVIGKCLYEGILIDVNFAGFFLLKWALTGGSTVATNESAYRASINDLREYDEELYQGLLKLKYYPGNVEADFGLNFTVNDTLNVQDEMGKITSVVQTVNLYPDGGNKAVDNVWRHLYIDRIVKYRLQDQPEKVTNAFLRGLGQIISPTWLAMFNQKELQKLVGGDSSELDIADLRRNTQYGGIYVIGDDGLEHPTVELFWKAMQEMDDGDRRKVLKFVTSTPRAPLLGFGNLNPKFSIRDSSSDQSRLPSTSTCVNLLKLPRYGDLSTMKDKLLYAANAGAGFDLS
jgi:ubiquitin-protein ligase E3 C